MGGRLLASKGLDVKAKILIVGGGAMGTCTAMQSARRCDPLREPVVLLEKDRLGAGSSGRSSAILHQAYGERKLAGMSRDALKTYSGIKSTSGRSVGYRKTGALILAGANDSEMAQRLEAEVLMHKDLGIASSIVNAEEIRSIVPGIEVANNEVGAWQPEGGFVDPARAIMSFATLARSYGASTRIGIEEPKILVDNGKIAGVETSAGTFEAPNVVVTAGPWTPKILAELGVDLPLSVVQTEECFLRMPNPDLTDDDEEDRELGHADMETRFLPDPLDAMPVAHPVIVDLPNEVLMRCEPGSGRTRIERLSADFIELAHPDELQKEVTSGLQDWIRDQVVRRLPVYEAEESLGCQTSWTTLTPDRRPLAGPIDAIPGLYAVAGTTGNDFQLAPSIGEGLSQMILGQPVSAFDPEFFSPGRFQSQ